MKANSSEHGQVLVLIILTIAGLMGFAALAVDGGQVFAERRRAQSAADSAALAAAIKGSALASHTDVIDAGEEMATGNGFTSDGTTVVDINNPPEGDSPYTGNSLYYQAIITTKVRPIFAQFVFGGDEWITVEAVVQAEPVSPFTGPNAIIGLDKESGNKTVEFDGGGSGGGTGGTGHGHGGGGTGTGNVNIEILGGNIYSNSDFVFNGGSGGIKITSGQILYTGTRYLHGADCGPGKNVDPCPTQTPQEITVPNLPEPYCPSASVATNPTNIGGVNYYVWTSTRPYPHTLQPGIHCFYTEISLTGSGDKLEGDGVVLVLKDGGIKLAGGTTLAVTRPDDLIDKNGNQVGGLLIYVSKDNYKIVGPNVQYPDIMVGGTSESKLNGTVFAPNSLCKIGGSSVSNTFHTSIICNEVKFHGNLTLYVDYRAEENIQLSPKLSVSQ